MGRKGKIIMIGSSVCVGSGAANNRGWSTLLAEYLQPQGWEVSNCAIGGQTTTDILLRLDKDVIQHRPEICIVGLGLANEGLGNTADLMSAKIIQGIFEHNLQMILQALQKTHIQVMLGGVYPNNSYREIQSQILRETNDHMLRWHVPVFNWLPTLDDGKGHFKEGLYYNAGHPNESGYQVMFAQIPKSIFD